MKQLVVPIIAAMLAWPSLGQASFYQLNGTHTVDEKAFAQAYEFVVSKVGGDPIDRTKCPIRIRFADLKGLLAFTPLNSTGDGCQDEIIFDDSLNGNWRAQIVLVHELVHLIRHHYNPYEELWLDEGLAKLLEVLYVGFWPFNYEEKLRGLTSFRLSNDQSDYGPNGNGYVTSFFLLWYLHSRFGEKQLTKELMTSSQTGWQNVEHSLSKLSERKIFKIPPRYLTKTSIWKHFGVALASNDPMSASWGFFLIDYQFTALINVDNNFFQSEKTEGIRPWEIRFHTRIPSLFSSLSSYYIAEDSSVYRILDPSNLRSIPDRSVLIEIAASAD